MASSYNAMKKKKETETEKIKSGMPKYTKESLQKQYPNHYYSDHDIDLMNNNEKAASGLISAKNSYLSAPEGIEGDNQRAVSNQNAEYIRKNWGGYSGGKDGSEYNPYYKATDVQAPTYNKPVDYTSKYGNRISQLYDELADSKFDYDVNSDPSYQALKAQANRNGQAAMQNTLAASAGVGGLASSTATQSAAAQEYNNYIGQLNDAIPELYQNAYSRYQNDLANKYNNIAMLLGMDDTAYSRYRDNVGDSQNEYSMQYQKWLQDIANNQYEQQYSDSRDDLAYDRAAAQSSAEAAAQQQMIENLFKEAEITGIYNDNPTMARQELSDTSNQNWEKINQDDRRINIDEQSAIWDYLIKNRNADISAQNAQTNAYNADTNSYNAQTNRMKANNDYDINNREIELKYGKNTSKEKQQIEAGLNTLATKEEKLSYLDGLANDGAVDQATYKEMKIKVLMDEITGEENSSIGTLISGLFSKNKR